MTDEYLKTGKPLPGFSPFPNNLGALWPTGEHLVFKKLAAPWLMESEYRWMGAARVLRKWAPYWVLWDSHDLQ